MKEENEKAGVRNKKLYLYIALGCAAVLLCAAIIVTAVVLANRSRVSIDAGDNSGGQIETPDPDQPVIETPEEFISPVSVVSVLNEYGFYYNKTLGNYYEHMGVDFTAEVGSEVYAVASGTVESVYTSDVLVGTQITIDHGDGVQTLYASLQPDPAVETGDSVTAGQVIGQVGSTAVAEADRGAHLHFSVTQNGEPTDPEAYLKS